jgi:hypothetical protein
MIMFGVNKIHYYEKTTTHTTMPANDWVGARDIGCE